MTKLNYYKYVGTNGTVLTPVILPTVEKIDLYRLFADEGYILTNGNIQLKQVDVLVENLNNWTEIPE